MRKYRVESMFRGDSTAPTESQKMQMAWDESVAEVAAEDAAVEHRRLAPVRELQKKLDIAREKTAKDARADLITWEDSPYLQEILPAFYQPQGDLTTAIQDAFRMFADAIKNDGYEVTDAGLIYLQELSEKNRKIAYHSTSPNTFCRLFYFLKDEVRAFREGVHFTSTRPVREEPKVRPLSEIETAENEWTESLRETFAAWEKHLAHDYGLTLTDSMRRECCDYMTRHNLSPLVAANFDTTRIWAAKSGIFPLRKDGTMMLLDSESLSEYIEGLDLSSDSGKAAYRRAVNQQRFKQ